MINLHNFFHFSFRFIGQPTTIDQFIINWRCSLLLSRGTNHANHHHVSMDNDWEIIIKYIF